MPRRRRATPPLLRALNERTVLDAIREAEPISRAEISRRSGISKPTLSLALRSLLDAGLVREAERGPDGPGYGAVYFEPVSEAALVLGLDLGARFVRGAVCDLRGTIRARQDVELAVADVEGATEATARLRDSLLEAAALDPELLDSVVVGVPGVVAGDGTLRLIENVSGLEGRPSQANCGRRSNFPSHSRTTSTWPRSESSGRASPAGSTTSPSSRSAPAWAQGSSWAASSTA